MATLDRAIACANRQLHRFSARLVTSISKASTLDEIADFWDTHSLADYWDQTHEVEFEIRAQRRRRVVLAPEVYQAVASEARARGVLPETLVNLWLAERLKQAGA